MKLENRHFRERQTLREEPKKRHACIDQKHIQDESNQSRPPQNGFPMAPGGNETGFSIAGCGRVD